MDQPKILCRLRSRHAARTRKTRNRLSPLLQLREALDHPSIKRNGGIRQPELYELRTKARELELLFLKLETDAKMDASRNEPLERLFEIIQKADSFASSSHDLLVAALGASRRLDPSAKEYIPVAVRKLARYSLASRHLVTAARTKKYSIFNTIKVEHFQVSIPSQHPFPGPFPTLDQALRNLMSSRITYNGNKRDLRITALLRNLTQSKSAAFEARLCSATPVWKVHAEIQLLAYHELNPGQPKPRVIGSSKDACYLCNLFVNLHGQFQVLRSHGRIYDRWLLPDWLDFPNCDRMNLAMVKLNASIENTIISTVDARRINRNHPNESTLFSIKAFSGSTVEALQLPTPAGTPRASAAPSLGSIQGEFTRPEPNSLTSADHYSMSEDEQVGVVEEVNAGSTHRILDNSPITPDTSYPKEQLNDKPRLLASAETMGAASISPDTLESPNPSFGSPETTPRGAVRARHSSSLIISKDIDDSKRKPNISSTLSPADMHAFQNSPSPAVSQPDLASPGNMSTLSSLPNLGVLTPADQDIYLEIGKLHLILTRDLPPLKDMKNEAPEDSDGWVRVKLLDQNEQHNISGRGKGEKIDAQAMAPGEEITVARGAVLSKNDLLLACGRDVVVSIRYMRPP